MRKRTGIGSAGFSLVEILVAVAVLGFVILGLLWSEKQKWFVLSRGDQAGQAMRAIEQHIESKRIGVLTTKNLPAAGTKTTTTRNGMTLKDSVGTAQDLDGKVFANVRSLTVWAMRPGKPDTVRIQTHIARDF